LKVRNVSDVRQIEVHATEPLVPGPSHLEVEIAVAELNKYQLQGSDQIPTEQIQAGGETLLSMNHKLIDSVWNKNLLLYQFTKRMTKLIVIIIMEYHCYQLHTKMYQISLSQC
jgi:hypothetical protein